MTDHQQTKSLGFQEKPILIFILVLALVRGVIYASFVPPWQAPDEPAQFERAKAAIKTADWNSTAANPPDWYEALSESLFSFRFGDYLFVRVNMKPGEPLDHYIVLYHEIYEGRYGSRPTFAVMGFPAYFSQALDITLQLYLVRLNMVLMSVGIVFFAFLITRTIFPNDPFLKLGVPIFILFQPQHTHLLAAVNNGNLTELLATVALYFMVKMVVKGFSVLNIAAVIGFSLAAMWAKATGYFLFIPIGVVVLFALWQYRRYWRWLTLAGVVLVGLVLFFAPDRLRVLMNSTWSYVSTGEFQLNPELLPTIFQTFWASPGWITLRLHPFWYQLLLIACALAVAGLIVTVIRNRGLIFSAQFQPRVKALVLLGLAFFAAIGVQVGWHVLTGTMSYRQGRTIYPVIVPIAIFLLLGWKQLIPPAWQKTGLLAVALAFFLFDSLVLFDYIIPFFYSRY